MKKRLAFPLILLLLSLSPACAMAADLPPDGQYTIAVTLSGGSGRATVESPVELTVEDGAMTAVIVWSSPYYDFMLVDGAYYYPVNTEGNSTFEIPVSALDVDIPISAETTAMSEPHVIDYALRFDSSTLKAAGSGPTVIIVVAAAVILAAALLAAVLVKRKRKRGLK
jgi:hypothetical protein